MTLTEGALRQTGAFSTFRTVSALIALGLVSASCVPYRTPPPPVPGPTPAPDGSTLPPRTDGLPRAGNPPFYEVFGRRYQVLDSSVGYSERGVASWYGSKFDGRPTANGEIFDMHSLTAAHRTLPLPTYAKVTNLTNGRSVVVRINDRGPFKKNRIIDLSFAAARELGLVERGTGTVEVVALEAPAQSPSALVFATQAQSGSGSSAAPALAENAVTLAERVDPDPAPAREVYLQVGAFTDAVNAEQMRLRLYDHGYDNVAVHTEVINETPIYRVRLGPVVSVDEYDRLVEQMAAIDIVETYLAVQ